MEQKDFIFVIVWLTTTSLTLTILSCILFRMARTIHQNTQEHSRVKFHHYNTFIPTKYPLTSEV